MQTPPRYGDYEAQRHWMEITINLPPSKWCAVQTWSERAGQPTCCPAPCSDSTLKRTPLCAHVRRPSIVQVPQLHCQRPGLVGPGLPPTLGLPGAQALACAAHGMHPSIAGCCLLLCIPLLSRLPRPAPALQDSRIRLCPHPAELAGGQVCGGLRTRGTCAGVLPRLRIPLLKDAAAPDGAGR